MNNNAKQKKIFNSRPLFYGFLALMLAVCTSRYLFVGNLKYLIFVSIILSGFVAYSLFFKRYKILFFIMAIFLFGIGWFFVGQASFYGRIYLEPVVIVGRVSDDIKYVGNEGKGGRAEIVLKNVKVDNNDEKNIFLTVYYESVEDVKVGDILKFEAELSNVHLFEFETFNLTGYRDKTPYSCKVNVEDVEIVGNRLTIDEAFRIKVKETLYESMGKENGSVAFAVLFGNKNDIETDAKNNYKMSGIIHLLTVSGLHITFLISLLGFVLNKFKIKRWINFLVCGAILGLYAWLCGWSPSVLRAGIMGLVLLFTTITGRCYDNLSSLGFAGIIIILISPLSALDNGFLMSLFCVGGIFIVSPWLSKILRKIFPKFVAEAFSISIASQIMILPFMATFFSTVNFLSFFVNLIVVPFFSILYPLLFVSTLTCLALPFLGFLLKGCALGFELIDKVAEFFASTKLVLKIQPIDIFICLFLFVFLFLMARYFMTSKKVKLICASVIFAVFGVFMAVSALPKQSQSAILFCSLYNESAILITTNSGQTAIIDGISYQNTYRLIQNEGLKEIDNYFVLNSNYVVEGVIEGFSVNNVIGLKQVIEDDKFYYAKKNTLGQIGDFSFNYLASDDKLIGLEVMFDDFNLFVLYDDYLSEDERSILKDKAYDCVFIGEKSEYSSYFNYSCAYGLCKNEKLDYNYNEDGNMKCILSKNKFVWRCLD